MMTPSQTKMLLMLARVQYLNTSQMLRYGIFNAEITLKRHRKNLLDRGYIFSSAYGVQAGVGKLQALYGLTNKGAKYLVDFEYIDPEKIKVSQTHKGEIKAPRDYHHRTGLIDSILAILAHLEALETREEFLELYFRKYGQHEPKRTQIKLENGSNLEPDAILHFKDPEEGRDRLYLIEFYEDSEQVERVRKSLQRHEEAIRHGTPSDALGVQVGHRVLCVFRHEHTARAVMRYLATDPIFTDIQNRFLCITLDALKADAFNQWATPKHTKTTLY